MTGSAHLTDRPVLDADHERVGTIIGAEVSPRTHEARFLLIELEPNLQEQLGLEDGAVWLPYSHIRSIRRNEVNIDETIRELLLVPAAMNTEPPEQTMLPTMRALVDSDPDPPEESTPSP